MLNSVAADAVNRPRQWHDRVSLIEATVRQTQLLVEWGRRLVVLVLAALFQDVGRLLPSANRSAGTEFDETRTASLERQHPAIGAAILGTIQGAPVELPLLVGQHHERLDGCGFPRRLAAGEIIPDAAILAAATRFARLCLDLDSGEPARGAAASRPIQAAHLLLAEAQWGIWPVEFATRLSERVAAAEEGFTALPTAIPREPAGLPPARSELERDAPDRREQNRQLHGRERGLPGLHAGAVRRFTEPGWYEKKMLIDRESR